MHDRQHQDSPGIVALQPRPIACQVYHSDRGGAIETAIARAWRMEDARRCRLCARCSAMPDEAGKVALCLKVHEGYVPLDEAELFRDLTGLGGVVALDRRAGSCAPA